YMDAAVAFEPTRGGRLHRRGMPRGHTRLATIHCVFCASSAFFVRPRCAFVGGSSQAPAGDGGRPEVGSLSLSLGPPRIAFMEAHAADIALDGEAAPVAAGFERRVRDLESERLSPLATPSYPATRAVDEAACPLRTPF